MEEIKCTRCNTVNEFYVEEAGPHLKAICNHCNRYIKFVSQKNSRPPENTATKIMSQGLYGSICLEDMFDGHTGRSQDGSTWVNITALQQDPFQVSEKNGKHYVNLVFWLHDEPDKFNFNAAMHLSLPRDAKEKGIKPKYVGNFRYMASTMRAVAPVQGPPAGTPPQGQGMPPGFGPAKQQGETPPGPSQAPGSQWGAVTGDLPF